MKKNILIFFFVMLLASCEKNVTIHIPEKDPSLVINGWLQKDEMIILTVGKSRHILAPGGSTNQQESYTVKDAMVVVFENNVPVDTLVYQPAQYNYKTVHGKKIRAGYTYTIKVLAPGFKTAEGVTLVPSQSEIGEVKRVKNARVNSAGEHADEVTIKLNDPTEKNFYLIQFFSPAFSGMSSGYGIYCVSTTDKDIEPIGDDADPLSTDNCYDGGNLIMRDDNFNGLQKQLKFYIPSNELRNYVGQGGKVYRPYVKVHRITEDYFKYIKSYHVYYNASDNPFAEPVNVYSNIKNGYGTFSAYTTAVDTLR